MSVNAVLSGMPGVRRGLTSGRRRLRFANKAQTKVCDYPVVDDPDILNYCTISSLFVCRPCVRQPVSVPVVHNVAVQKKTAPHTRRSLYLLADR